MQRIDKEAAMKFSFLMSVPAVVGIFVLDVVIGGSPLPVSIIDLFLIEVIVFVTGLLSMEFLLRLAGRVKFWMLCLVLGVVAILFGIPSLFS
jgi:undecaprenyl-diphosphatase